MKDAYDRPIYRLERVRGARARYQNSETGQWTPWVWPTASAAGFPDALDEKVMAELLYAYAVRRSFGAVKRQVQVFGEVIRDISKEVALHQSIERHPAGSKLLEADDADPADVLVHLTEEVGLYDITDDEIERAGAEADHPGLATVTTLPTVATKERIESEERLSKYTVAELRQVIRELPYPVKMNAPGGGFSKMRKAELIAWIIDNDPGVVRDE